MDIRNIRFFRWYRIVPIAIMVAMLILSIGVRFMPKDFVRSLFFPVSYAERIDTTAARYGVDPRLVAAVIRCESGWNEFARSRVGAIGLMQLMPDTAHSIAEMGLVDIKKYDPDNLTDPATNIEYGTALLSYLQTQLATTDEVIAAYNAGLSTVQSWLALPDSAGIPNAITYPETYHYVQRVDEALRQYRMYYPHGLSAV